MPSVLLLEDDEVLASQIGLVLQQDGHSMDHAKTHEEAVELFNNQEFEILIVDLFIRSELGIEPRGGLSFMMYVRTICNSTIPIIAISGSFSPTGGYLDTGSHFSELSHSSGAQITLAKPFEPELLLRAIEKLASRQKS